MLNGFPLYTLSSNYMLSSMCTEPEKALEGGIWGEELNSIKEELCCVDGLESHLANCLQDAFQITVSQKAAGFVGLN